MQDIHKFISQFTEKKYSVVRNKNRCYMAEPEMERLLQHRPASIGIFLGTEGKERFLPSLGLLSILAKDSSRKVCVNEKAEWLFICGRDVFGDSVTKWGASSGLVLVQNQKGENLGLGFIKQSGQKKLVKNILDIGDFLRRKDS